MNEEKTCSLWNNESGVVIENVKICDLQEFKNHPFKLKEDSHFFELVKSIEEQGVLNLDYLC